MFHVIERLWAGLCGAPSNWTRLLREEKIDCLVGSSYASERILPALQAAANLGVKTVIVANSWKDIYSKPRVPVTPDLLAVWSENVREDLAAANPQMRPDTLAVAGSLHLERFLHLRNVEGREEFCSRVGLAPSRPFICYTAASPAAVRNEPLVVECLLKAAASCELPGRPQFLLRINPREDGKRFEPLAARYSDLVIQKPLWEWDAESDWNCALPEDTDLWVATAFHSALNVSVCSTVTLEFAALGRPVVNVCFDLPHPLPAMLSNRRFWDADFYREVRQSGYAQAAFTREDLLRLVAEALRSGKPGADPAALLPCREPVDVVVSLVERVLNS
ncbi:MAG: hypothetical protein LLG20_13955 [Acidobacteriales bacterium]|nr:hypothetical protein [Terriglobales bacterium]